MQYRKLLPVKTYNAIAHELEAAGFSIIKEEGETYYKQLCKVLIEDDLYILDADDMLKTSNQITIQVRSKPYIASVGYLANGRLIIKKVKVYLDVDQTPWVAWKDVS